MEHNTRRRNKHHANAPQSKWRAAGVEHERLGAHFHRKTLGAVHNRIRHRRSERQTLQTATRITGSKANRVHPRPSRTCHDGSTGLTAAHSTRSTQPTSAVVGV